MTNTDLTKTIETLREAFGKVKSMDPCGPVYDRLCKILDSADDEAMVAAMNAKIPFVSSLARNRAVRRKLVTFA